MVPAHLDGAAHTIRGGYELDVPLAECFGVRVEGETLVLTAGLVELDLGARLAARRPDAIVSTKSTLAKSA